METKLSRRSEPQWSLGMTVVIGLQVTKEAKIRDEIQTGCKGLRGMKKTTRRKSLRFDRVMKDKLHNLIFFTNSSRDLRTRVHYGKMFQSDTKSCRSNDCDTRHCSLNLKARYHKLDNGNNNAQPDYNKNTTTKCFTKKPSFEALRKGRSFVDMAAGRGETKETHINAKNVDILQNSWNLLKENRLGEGEIKLWNENECTLERLVWLKLKALGARFSFCPPDSDVNNLVNVKVNAKSSVFGSLKIN
ncbi:hypothetical protein Tco_1308592 [Tanacetum coccineum]